ncbi:MAG TPA: phosphopantetheine-binding protein, partial [Luteolibacter sp.]
MPASTLRSDDIRALLETTFGLQPGELHDDTALFSSGLLDSFHLVEMIAVLEKTSGRKIKPGEINLENLDTPG